MNLATTMLFYLLVGAAVAGAIYLRPDRLPLGDRVFRAATALIFWPLYLPVLLQGSAPESSTHGNPSGDATLVSAPVDQELAEAIRHVEAELDLALSSLDGWSDGVLERERDRFVELRGAWRQQAGRVADLNRLLALKAFVSETDAGATGAAPRVHASETARRDNIARLRCVRERLRDDLIANLAKVRELVTMIHLARYTGAPASRAEELLAEITAAVAGLSEVAEWRQNDAPPGLAVIHYGAAR